MKRIIVLLLFCVYSSSILLSQNSFRVVFYNVENLFDIKNNPFTNDDAFVPDGDQHWNSYRYWEKLKSISKVVDSIGMGYPPAIIGMCEVENDSVLFDLCKRSPMRKHKYEYIITQSNDDRGINVALLYQRDEIKILSTKEFTPVFDEHAEKRTRNVLHVSGKIINSDTLDLFVCHFPSRAKGIKRTQSYRIQTAKLVRQKTDSILAIRKLPHIIIMGDFNDYPDDISIRHILEAKSLTSEKQPNELYNMFLHRALDKDFGTYKYRGKWKILDQFIVNGNLLKEENKTRVKDFSAQVYSADFILEKDTKYGGMKPFRTYSGWTYLGGISDHLPIYIDLTIEEN